jgi:hypothetical protein
MNLLPRVFAFLFFAATLLSADPAAPTSPAVSGPRLFFSPADLPAIRARAHDPGWLGQTGKAIIARANQMLDTPTAPYSLASQNNGPLTDGRALQERLGLLTFAGYLTNDPRYAAEAKAILLAVVRQFPDPNNTKDWATHLQVADAAQAFVIGYDWLDPQLSPAERAEVRAQIERFGAWLYAAKTVWASPDPSPSSCNHTAVHYGALGLCALALGDHPEWLAKATERVRAYFKYSMDSTGYVTESHGYMAYGLLGALPFSYALRRAGGPDLVGEQPLVAQENSQILWKLLPGGPHILTLNDSKDTLDPAGVLTYAMFRFHQRVELWAWLQIEGETGDKTFGIERNGYLGSGLSAPFILIWGDPSLQPESPAEAGLPLAHRYASGRVFLRSSWTDPDATHVSFTSGYDFHYGHHHQDENAVTLYALREAFLMGPDYEANITRCHNTMIIGGEQQSVTGRGDMLGYREDANGVFARGQAASSYNHDHVTVGNFDRKIYFVRGPSPYLIWRDDASLANHAPTDFVDLFHTDPKNKIEMVPGGFRIIGSRTGGQCLVRILHPPDAAIQQTDLKDSGFVRPGSNGSHIIFSHYFREATASLHGTDPQFVALVFPYRDEAEIPRIDFSGAGADDRCTLTFADGRKDMLTLGPENIVLKSAEGGRP